VNNRWPRFQVHSLANHLPLRSIVAKSASFELSNYGPKQGQAWAWRWQRVLVMRGN